MAHEVHSITTTTLDQYVRRNGIARIDLLKLDIEGHELAALQGATQLLKAKVVKAIFFEYSELIDHIRNPKAVLDFLDAAGYVCCLCTATKGSTAVATHSIRQGLPGHGLQLSLVGITGKALGHVDLLAVPAENLAVMR
jgi:hypothetical protein